ncbi:MAG: hypothetical protein IJQ87_03900 [Clostridia bacterium]|nr:hypothetical protein [Clostridia bacterium]
MALKDVISIVISCFAFVLSMIAFCYTKKRAKAEALVQFLNEGDTKEMKDKRIEIYNNKLNLVQKKFINKLLDRENRTDEDTKLERIISDVISFYDKWAALYNHGYLPKWAIDGPRATVLINIYELAELYINERIKEDTYYAMDIIKLYKIKKIERLK